MNVTEYGRKQLGTKQVKAYLLDFAVTHLIEHRMSIAAVRESLGMHVARLLAGTAKNPLAMGTELTNIDDFERENEAEIKIVVDRTMDDALPALADYNKAATE